MAFEYLGPFSQVITAGINTIALPDDVRPYSAVLNLTNLIGCTLDVAVQTYQAGMWVDVWNVTGRTVDATTLGLAVPPWPSSGAGIQLVVTVTAGTPDQIDWDLFGL